MCRLLTILICLLWALPVEGEDEVLVMPDRPKLTVTLDPPGDGPSRHYVHAQLVLRVQLASRFAFEELDLRLPEIADAEIITLQRPRTRHVRSYVGNGHVFETVIAIFPQSSGALAVPGVEVSGIVATPDGVEQPFSTESPPLQIDIAGIDPDFTGSWWLVSDRIAIEEAWSEPVEKFRFGDIVRRDITITAYGVGAEQVPKLQHGRTRGISVVDAGRTARTERTSGGLVTNVTQSFDLKIESDGVAYISPIGLAYWSPTAQAEQKASVAGVRIEPLPADEAKQAAALMREAQSEHAVLQKVGIAVLTALLTPLLIVAALGAWLVVPSGSERRLAEAIGNPASMDEIHHAIEAWARISGIHSADLNRLTSFHKLQLTLFSSSRESVDRRLLRMELGTLARRQRVRRLRQIRSSIATALLGPQYAIATERARAVSQKILKTHNSVVG